MLLLLLDLARLHQSIGEVFTNAKRMRFTLNNALNDLKLSQYARCVVETCNILCIANLAGRYVLLRLVKQGKLETGLSTGVLHKLCDPNDVLAVFERHQVCSDLVNERILVAGGIVQPDLHEPRVDSAAPVFGNVVDDVLGILAGVHCGLE